MLKDRQNEILHLIIQNFSETKRATGSKTLMNQGIQASSATIRNDMSLLESLGFIEKNHTSSGRQPTIEGLRYFVDSLLDLKKLDNLS
ncbi:MAG: heat-inducible transcriptional repressor HrcA, partial [Streptococcaceae bacterium]|nr:heat-inducible transcriptional repressor HrcA [Streptococcaceae bacterium]